MTISDSLVTGRAIPTWSISCIAPRPNSANSADRQHRPLAVHGVGQARHHVAEPRRGGDHHGPPRAAVHEWRDRLTRRPRHAVGRPTRGPAWLLRPAHALTVSFCICNHICVYEIRFATDVEDDLKRVRVHDRRRILDSIEVQLSHQPTVATRNRKILVDLTPAWEANPPIWELRVGAYRVFYDVDEDRSEVYVRAVREKPPDQRTEDII